MARQETSPRKRRRLQNIVVCSPDPIGLKQARDFLLAEGYDVRTATDDVEALLTVRLFRPDVVILPAVFGGLTAGQHRDRYAARGVTLRVLTLDDEEGAGELALPVDPAAWRAALRRAASRR